MSYSLFEYEYNFMMLIIDVKITIINYSNTGLQTEVNYCIIFKYIVAIACKCIYQES